MQINNIIFMGTPDFAVPCLDKLHQNYNVTAVITQPDRPTVERCVSRQIARKNLR